jgi:4'-phosphopantetheinyl transferase
MGPGPIQLPKGEVHLWTVLYDGMDEEQLEPFRKLLPDGLLERGNRLKFREHRIGFWASQGALRALLGTYLQEDPLSVRIERHAKGKPWCGNDPSIRFNMSDTGGLTVFAFARDRELGVDVEAIRPLKDLEGMIRKNFQPSEMEEIRRGKDELERFFRFWTFKESYLKAIGEGMRLPPDRLEFRLEQGRPKLISAGDGIPGEEVRSEEFVPRPGYVGTLTLWGNEEAILHKEWDLRKNDEMENDPVWK